MENYIAWIKEKYGSKIKIEAIGNHYLERNSVYKIDDKKIVKFYSEDRTWEREIKALNFINEKSELYPQIIDNSGEDEIRWIEFSILKGSIYKDIEQEIAENLKSSFYYEMGINHAQLHKMNELDQYYDWATSSSSYKEYNSYREFETDKNRRRGLIALKKANNINKDLLNNAYAKMLEKELLLDCCKKFSICHNDYSERNIIVNIDNKDLRITGIIDFELSYPSSIESDVSRTLFAIYFSEYKEDYLKGYKSIIKLNGNFDKLLDYYLLAMGLEVCSWSYDKDKSYYDYALKILHVVTKR